MAELEAIEKDDSKGWRRHLPEGAEVKLGRTPGPDGLAADWDGFISGVHATLLWKGGKLLVRRRLLPRPTLNPIYYKAVEADEFSLAPGERFVIGGTSFALLAAEEAAARDATPLKPELTQLVYSRKQLQEVRFVDADRRIAALAALPRSSAIRPATPTWSSGSCGCCWRASRLPRPRPWSVACRARPNSRWLSAAPRAGTARFRTWPQAGSSSTRPFTTAARGYCTSGPATRRPRPSRTTAFRTRAWAGPSASRCPTTPRPAGACTSRAA